MLLFSISGLSNNIVASITKTFIYFLSKKGPRLLLLLYLNVPLFLFYVPLSMTLANRFQMGRIVVWAQPGLNFVFWKTRPEKQGQKLLKIDQLAQYHR